MTEKRLFSESTGFSGLLLLLGTIVILGGCQRIEIRDRTHYRWSTADSGLVLRQGPGLQYAKIGTIPYGARVRMLGIASPTTIIDGRGGRWNRVAYQGLFGYSFDAFLSRVAPGSGQPHAIPTAAEERVAHAGHVAPSRSVPHHGPPPAAPLSLERQQSLEKGPAGSAEKRSRSTADESTPSAAEPPPSAAEPPPSPAKPPPSPKTLAYARHDPSGLIKMSLGEFRAMAGTLGEPFADTKSAYRSLAVTRHKDESLEDYLRRSEDAKRSFLHKLRRREHSAASRVFSIYDAPLDLGSYDPASGRISRLGTSVPIDSPGMVTLPGKGSGSHRFVNGTRYSVKLPAETAAAIQREQEDILVRLDFSYTESLQDLFNWTLQAYFLPRYLALYHRETGLIFYACTISPRVELPRDPAAPLKISVSLFEETIF